jgi:hypothetical protein
MSLEVNLSYMPNHSLYGVTVSSVVAASCYYPTFPSSRRGMVQHHRNTAGTPPSRRSDKAWCQERGVTVVPYLLARAHPPTNGVRYNRDKTGQPLHDAGFGRWTTENSD